MAATGLALGLLAVALGKQFRNIRLGRYSFECYAQSFLIVFAHFEPFSIAMPIANRWQPSWIRKRFRIMSEWLIGKP